jgi:quercetin dioxygenase-like cupin family protein
MKPSRKGTDHMPGKFLKNIPFAESLVLNDLVDYQEGRVVSRTFAQTNTISLTLFAFDQGEGLSTHTAAGDAFVHILDGEAAITIGGKDVTLKAGEVVAMPADVPHSLQAEHRFKMLLVVVKGSD